MSCDPELCFEVAFETPHTREDGRHWRSLEAAWVQLGSHGWTHKEGFEMRFRPWRGPEFRFFSGVQA